MNNHVLFVFEGEKTEKQIVANLSQYFFSERTIIQCVYCNDIYELHKEIVFDEDLDAFMLLKEIPQNKALLSNFSRNDFAEIYLFFDYDGHDTLASDEKVEELLAFFDEETSYGKLFLSYPMVEALKHIPSNLENFKTLKVQAKENIKYKQLVNNEARKEMKQINKYTSEIWGQLLELHLSKLNFLINNDYTIPKQQILQLKIFYENEMEKKMLFQQAILERRIHQGDH